MEISDARVTLRILFERDKLKFSARLFLSTLIMADLIMKISRQKHATLLYIDSYTVPFLFEAKSLCLL